MGKQKKSPERTWKSQISIKCEITGVFLNITLQRNIQALSRDFILQSQSCKESKTKQTFNFECCLNILTSYWSKSQLSSQNNGKSVISTKCAQLCLNNWSTLQQWRKSFCHITWIFQTAFVHYTSVFSINHNEHLGMFCVNRINFFSSAICTGFSFQPVNVSFKMCSIH